MAANITIDKSQYRNISCKLGKKNYINTVNGKEYKIDTTSSVEYEEGKKNCAPSALATYKTNYTTLVVNGKVLWATVAQHYLREEVSYIEGSYMFTVTGKTITGLNNMTADYSLNYKSYSSGDSLITSGNYNSSARIFSAIKSENNRPSETKDNDYDGNTTGLLPHDVSKMPGGWGYWLVSGNQTSGCNIPSQYCNVTFVRKESVSGSVNPNYIFRVSFRFVISSGWHIYSKNLWATVTHENHYHEVQNIQISVKGFTVEKEEINVQEGQSDKQGAKVLELQTNELMQSSTSTGALSFSGVASEIISAYKANRLIVSFDLINNKKYVINGESRYLQAGDIVKIKGVDDKYLQSQNNNDSELGNDFEIIKANSKYDGFYYREIVAKEILNSNS